MILCVCIALSIGVYIWNVDRICRDRPSLVASCPNTPATLDTNAEISAKSGVCATVDAQSKCQASCKDGFEALDAAADGTYTCGENGEWTTSDSHPLVCDFKHCGEDIPGLDPNAQASCVSDKYLDPPCRAQCKAQYNSSGGDTFKCDVDTDGHGVRPRLR